MFVLFDNGTPRTLARYLIDHHAVTEARARGWDELGNGDLLTEAEAAGFEVLVTTDKNLRHQQNLAGRRIAVVVLGQGRWSLLKPHVAKIVAIVNAAKPGSYAEVEVPYDERRNLYHPIVKLQRPLSCVIFNKLQKELLCVLQFPPD